MTAPLQRWTVAAPSPDGPRRIQLRRTRGWRLPPGAVMITRPGRWGNPFAITAGFRDRATALALYTEFVDQAGEAFAALVRRELAGRDLACWCPLTQPCHADLLLRIANSNPAPRGHRAALEGGR